jgi:hypothetical protein
LFVEFCRIAESRRMEQLLMTTITVRADEIETGDVVHGWGRVARTNLPTDDGYGDEDVVGYQTEDGREHVVRAEVTYVVDRCGNGLQGTSIFIAAAFVNAQVHAAYAYGNLTTCDCHSLVWHTCDLTFREEPGTWECPIPDEYAVDTSRRSPQNAVAATTPGASVQPAPGAKAADTSGNQESRVRIPPAGLDPGCGAVWLAHWS